MTSSSSGTPYCPRCNVAGPFEQGVGHRPPRQEPPPQPTAISTSQSYVDDVFQSTHHKSRRAVLQKAGKATVDIYEALQAEGFVMSGKNDISASHEGLAQDFQKLIKRQGVTAATPYEVRHLGLGNRGGRGAARVIKKARFLKSQLRIDNIARLARRQRKAAKLYSTGAWPMRFYGHQATGLAPTAILKVQRDSKMCTGMPKSVCTLTANLITYGLSGEPSIRARVEQVKEFIRIWDALDFYEIPKFTVQFKQLTDEMSQLGPPRANTRAQRPCFRHDSHAF